MSKEARVFFFHYNKPASRSAGKPQISVHWKNRCFIVDNVHCDVPIRGHRNKRQPFFVMKGEGVLTIRDFKEQGGRIAFLKSHLKSGEITAA